MTEEDDNRNEKKDIDRSQLFEELRFAKKQQWLVATSAVTLLAAIVALVSSVTKDKADLLGPKEKIVVAVVITLVATFGCSFLFMLQKYMRDTRLRLDESDKDAAVRGVSIVGVLAGVIVISAGWVLYFLVLR